MQCNSQYKILLKLGFQSLLFKITLQKKNKLTLTKSQMGGKTGFGE